MKLKIISTADKKEKIFDITGYKIENTHLFADLSETEKIEACITLEAPSGGERFVFMDLNREFYNDDSTFNRREPILNEHNFKGEVELFIMDGKEWDKVELNWGHWDKWL